MRLLAAVCSSILSLRRAELSERPVFSCVVSTAIQWRTLLSHKIDVAEHCRLHRKARIPEVSLKRSHKIQAWGWPVNVAGKSSRAGRRG
jgi:hypothetical protein